MNVNTALMLSRAGQKPARAPRPDVPLNAAGLPPAGASPAGDLQRRLSEAALLGFYRNARPRTWSRGRVALTIGGALASWTAVFGIGWLVG